MAGRKTVVMSDEDYWWLIDQVAGIANVAADEEIEVRAYSVLVSLQDADGRSDV